MFKNRELRVRSVKIDPVDGAEIPEAMFQIDAQKVVDGAKEIVSHAAVAVVGVYAARFVMITAHQVIVMKFEQKFR